MASNPSRLLSGTKDARHACNTPCESVLRLLHAYVGILLSSQVRATFSPRKSGPLKSLECLAAFSQRRSGRSTLFVESLDTLRFPPRNRGIHIKDDT